MRVISDPRVNDVFEAYPDLVRPKMEFLRTLVLETASEIVDLDSIEETSKWGEPSYVSRFGSTLRMDWKSKTPNHYAMYFKCTSRLVETFRKVYGPKFTFEGNRAIVFELNQVVPVSALKTCIMTTLTYHQVKQRPDLGMLDI